jgi:putative tryptophan/tyrosine transport system substrate-binding protein
VADCGRESEMKRREFITLLGGSSASLVWSLPLAAQRGAARLPRIGYLTLSPISDKPSPERVAFLQGLRELGYIEGKTHPNRI